MLRVRPCQTLSLQTRDGVRLDADVYYPDGVGPWPVLLMRQPYGRSIASTVVYAHPTWYAAHGYIVVIQDVRGRGTSEGEFQLFAHEREDGVDTVNWAAALPDSTGTVGMYGFSYQGMTQLYAAIDLPPALKTLCPAMVGYDLYADWAYEGGAFCLQANLGWAIQLAAETARLQGKEPSFLALAAAARNLPLSGPIAAQPQILQDLAPDSFYHDWLAHPQPDDYWEQLSPCRDFQPVDLPMLHIGGWFDTYLRGTLHLYREMVERSSQFQFLLVGPWAHLPWGRRVGAVDFGPEAANPIDRLQIRWFDQFLKEQDRGVLAELPISLFEMGSNCWRSFDRWPQPPDRHFFLSSSGLAALQEQDGQLLNTLPKADAIDVFVHDPWRPVPALGGHAAIPSGMVDRAALDCRSDVLTYTTPPLTTDLSLLGEITVELWCSADAPSFDLCAVLSDVHPHGQVFNLTQGYIRVAPGQPTSPLIISLQATCARLPIGHAVRLSLSAACFPAYPVNPGTGTLPTEARAMEARIITVTVHSGPDCPSSVRFYPAEPC
ncbi:S15 family X-Pro dipeptidyl-peptidase [Leptolyngbya sp. 'hensonii']|uniref:CocE/NonD family hydrolase n=1 Tax=Leptolyngbya sp. 'hensonii' TaxID=1922337 RepID=UPI00094FE617|nr:CocE/NonD family hydrolase [Leptolyngbya sp. 'hensonii']OLP20343.1 S15 family X-Pro dipeptidyl-peptidase [Leptolyngbya sp. 'hensonii']